MAHAIEKNKKEQHALVGKVISDKMQKTIVVETERIFEHPRFHKIVKNRRKYKVHDESEAARVGDIVEFFEAKPVSKTKYMYLRKVIKSCSTSE